MTYAYVTLHIRNRYAFTIAQVSKCKYIHMYARVSEGRLCLYFHMYETIRVHARASHRATCELVKVHFIG